MKSTSLRLFIVAIASACVMSAAMGARADDAMTNAELTQLLSGGKTIELGGPGMGYAGSLALNADGSGKGEAKTDGGDVLTLTGTWHVQGDTFCRTWKEFDDGKEVCETWVKDGANKVHVMVDGKEVGVNHW